MVEREIIVKETFKHKGMGNFKDFYGFMFNWLIDEGFVKTEKIYSETISGDSKSVEFKWEAQRELSDSHRAQVEVVTKAKGLKDIEIEIDGKRKRAQEFEIEVNVKGVLEKDYQNKWGTSSTQKFFKGIYNKFVIPELNDKMVGEVNDYVQNFKEEMKAFFDLLGKR